MGRKMNDLDGALDPWSCYFFLLDLTFQIVFFWSSSKCLLGGGKAAPFFSGGEPPKILYGGWQLMI